MGFDRSSRADALDLADLHTTRSVISTGSMEIPVKRCQKTATLGLLSARFPPHSILQSNFEVQYHTTSAPPPSPAPFSALT